MLKFLLLLLSLCTSMPAFCCTCTGRPEDSDGVINLEWMGQFDYIFTARIDSVRAPEVDSNGWFLSYNNLYEDVYLSTQTVYRGAVDKHIKINPPLYGSSCGFRLKGKEGKVYIFYGLRNNDGSIQTHFCYGSGYLYTLAELDTLSHYYWAPEARQEIKLLAAWDKQRNGKMTFTYKNGQTMGGGQLQNGNPNGMWTCYNYYGKVTSKGRYENGERVGAWQEYEYMALPNAKKNAMPLYLMSYSKGNYVQGKRTGIWMDFGWKTISKKIKGKWKSVPIYYLQESGNYVAGYKHGEWTRWNAEGKLIGKDRYNNGNIVK